ncbi:MAG TPA: B12-binding domain-containing radical SAM protein [Kofleriaceae bacterium]|jgi:radical SAM superfamily enzyme YgiQ (UPF0313 family)|nr:B12-binding domain-containing radical SAM protein [Kofleriaceae bacterium]
MVAPQFPVSYWGFEYALEFTGKKAANIPLALLTVAALFPDHYDVRLLDMRLRPLQTSDLEWADIVFVSAMTIQRGQVEWISARCREVGVPIVLGGPYANSLSSEISCVDHILVGEVEDTFATFLADWEAGSAARLYQEPPRPSLHGSPVPRYDLLDIHQYQMMATQFSRGCPFNCEFCDVTKIYGRVPRTKTNAQVISEFDRLYELGWRGNLFIVDDNFIGNRRDTMRLLPAIAEWQKQRGYPFRLNTEASVNLASSEQIMDAMVEAGFVTVFVGIETPTSRALSTTKKVQNVKAGVDMFLLESVKKLQHKGLEVTAGFIVGLDDEPDHIFQAMVDFIEAAGIQRAMVGLLNALPRTDLYHRLEREGRLLEVTTGNNIDTQLNFIPQMDPEVLVAGYKLVISKIYDQSLENYFERTLAMYERLNTRTPAYRLARAPAAGGIAKTILAYAGRVLDPRILAHKGASIARFLGTTAIKYPRLLRHALASVAVGYHLERVTADIVAQSPPLPPKRTDLVPSARPARSRLTVIQGN